MNKADSRDVRKKLLYHILGQGGYLL